MITKHHNSVIIKSWIYLLWRSVNNSVTGSQWQCVTSHCTVRRHHELRENVLKSLFKRTQLIIPTCTQVPFMH